MDRFENQSEDDESDTEDKHNLFTRSLIDLKHESDEDHVRYRLESCYLISYLGGFHYKRTVSWRVFEEITDSRNWGYRKF